MQPPSGKRMRTEEGSPRGTGTEDAAAKAIRLVSYNIRNGRNGGLEAALRAVAQANVDLGVLQETKADGRRVHEVVLRTPRARHRRAQHTSGGSSVDVSRLGPFSGGGHADLRPMVAATPPVVSRRLGEQATM